MLLRLDPEPHIETLARRLAEPTPYGCALRR